MSRSGKKAERLERVLTGEQMPHDAGTRRSVAAAGALVPGHTRNPARIEQTRDAMLAAFHRAFNPAEERDDAGSADGLEELPLHRAELELPDGDIVLSNLEGITDEQLAQVKEILGRGAKDHTS